MQSGIVTYVANLRPGLERAGVKVTVLTSEVAPGTDPAAVHLSRARPPRPIRTLVRRSGRLLSFDPTSVLLSFPIAHAANELRAGAGLDFLEMEESFGCARYVQQMTEVPVVVRLHGPHFLHAPVTGQPVDPIVARAERRCVAEAVGITSPARDVLDRVRRKYDLPLADAVVIPNPVPPVPADRRWTLEACDKKTVLFVGRFDRHKGGDIVIDAFRQLAARRPEAELLFVGPDHGLRVDGGSRSIGEYLDANVPAELRPRIHVAGALPASRIEPLRRQAFVTIMASRYEIFGLALAESLAFGCPTIAPNVGGIPEILLADRTGLLFEGGDASSLAARLATLFESPQRAADLARAAADDVATRLSPDTVARDTAAYYTALRTRAPRVPRRSPLLASLQAIAR
jgi:glycosyltransferase involved in cell wall biosynthesis